MAAKRFTPAERPIPIFEALDSRLLLSASDPLLEALLLAAIAFHAANGTRLILVDFGAGARIHKTLLAILMVVAAVVVLVGGAKLLGR